MYASDKHTMDLIKSGRRNRVATVFFYLSEVKGGGETMFFRANGKVRERFAVISSDRKF